MTPKNFPPPPATPIDFVLREELERATRVAALQQALRELQAGDIRLLLPTIAARLSEARRHVAAHDGLEEDGLRDGTTATATPLEAGPPPPSKPQLRRVTPIPPPAKAKRRTQPPAAPRTRAPVLDMHGFPNSSSVIGRAVRVLVEREGLDVDEVAKRMGVARNRAYNALYNAEHRMGLIERRDGRWFLRAQDGQGEMRTAG